MRSDYHRRIEPVQTRPPARLDNHPLHRAPVQEPVAGPQLHEQRIVQNAELLPLLQPGFKRFLGSLGQRYIPLPEALTLADV